MLVRNGYVVMTFDPRGQGRSDASKPYPHNTTCQGTYPTQTTAFNPLVDRTDKNRLGIAGHSLGGTGVSVVQSYGAMGAQAWPGKLDSTNPVKVVVAWDGIYTAANGGTGNAGGNLPAGTGGGSSDTPAVVPRVPILGLNGEYGLTPVPFTEPPDPKKATTNFREWVKADQPVIELTIAGSTHYEFSLLPNFPASSWCPDPASGACDGGWGNAFARHYTLAWFDRWLKQPGERGFADADGRLLADNGPQGRLKMSYRYHSARHFATREGQRKVCENIRKGCQVACLRWVCPRS